LPILFIFFNTSCCYNPTLANNSVGYYFIRTREVSVEDNPWKRLICGMKIVWKEICRHIKCR